jgi:hypothetical protein
MIDILNSLQEICTLLVLYAPRERFWGIVVLLALALLVLALKYLLPYLLRKGT